MVHHAIDGLEVLLALVVELLGFRLQLLEAPFGVDKDGIFGVFADVKLVLELLRCLQLLVSFFFATGDLTTRRSAGTGRGQPYPRYALGKASKTHGCLGIGPSRVLNTRAWVWVRACGGGCDPEG